MLSKASNVLFIAVESTELHTFPELVVERKEERKTETDGQLAIVLEHQSEMQQQEQQSTMQTPETHQLEAQRRAMQHQILQQQAAHIFFQQQLLQQQQQLQPDQLPPQQLILLNDFEAKYIVPPASVRQDEPLVAIVKTKDPNCMSAKTVTPVKCKWCSVHSHTSLLSNVRRVHSHTYAWYCYSV